MRLHSFLSFALILLLTTLFSNQSYCAPESIEDPTESLLSLPYIEYVKIEDAPKKTGTTIYNKNKASPGYNLYTSDTNKDVFVNLIDMDGTLIHRWARNQQNGSLRWKQATPFPDGSLFLSSEWTMPDWQWLDENSHSRAIYNIPGQKAHHSAYWLKTGGFLGLVENKITVPFHDLILRVQDNSLVHISAEGRPLKTIPLSKLFEKDPGYQKNLETSYKTLKNLLGEPTKTKKKNPLFDPLHANHIERLERDIPGVAKEGAWLITVRNLNKIIIFDPEKEEILWQWGDNIIDWPHHASFLKGDQILLLDNGTHTKSSRVIILDIKTKKIVWQYGQQPGQKFFTFNGGSAQQLPNGNILIAECSKGRAFEITLSGEIVWEWYNDLFTKGKHKEKRRVLYRIERIPYDFFKGVKFNYGKVNP
ncbi:MAG: hypothetical protein HQL21_05015 [Candidatus Omnitrophica bacterium]|nr:hypothetical protein [Candidatus Omnitrophota bacterium]